MKRFEVFAFVLVMFLLSGCYWNADIDPDQVGVQTQRNAIVAVVGPGVYTDLGTWAELEKVNVGTLTFSVDDPEVLTSDNQAIGLRVTIQARRNRDNDSVINLFTNWSVLKDDGQFVMVISATAREGMKNGVRGFTLDKLLDDRNGLAQAIRDQLELDAQKYSAEIVNVTIENVAPSAEYMKALSDKALLRVNTEVELQRRSLINQKASNGILQAEQTALVLAKELLVQQSQTAIDVEIATREGKKVAAAQQVYVDNPQAFELKRLELIQRMFGAGTVYFIPEGTNLTQFFNSTGLNTVPVPTP